MQDRYGLPEVYEDEAPWQLRLIYQDIKWVLGVPLVNLIFRVLAWYPQFLTLAWQQLRPNMLTLNAELAATSLRLPDFKMRAPQIEWGELYDARTVEDIRCVVRLFSYINPKLLLIASALAESLAERPICGGTPVNGWIQPGRMTWPAVRMVDVACAPDAVKPTLLDIARRHMAVDAASDFRVLANYPQFLNRAWDELRERMDSPNRVLSMEALKSRSVRLAHQLPYPVTISPQSLAQIYDPARIAGVMGIVSMFQEFLPGLIVDMAFLRELIPSDSA